MQTENKTRKCQNCKSDFVIEKEDFDFYKKIDVPEPTFCPQCRFQRRMAWRKEKYIFYKNKCQATRKELISSYNPKGPIKVFDTKYWWSDNWDPMEYGQNYDFSKNFFKQFAALLGNVPQPALINGETSKSEYCQESNYIKGCYLVTNSGRVEDTAFSNRIVDVKDSLDLHITTKSELCYETIYCRNSYKLFFSDHCDSCVESYFLYDCNHCKNCFGCTNLRHKKYHIFNEEYSKKEYFEKMASLDLGSFEKMEDHKTKFQELYLKAIHRFAHIVNSTDSTGNEIANSTDCKNCFDAQDCENMRYATWAGFGYPMKDAYDCGPGVLAGELTYESIGTGLGGGIKNMFSAISWFNHHVEYSYNCRNSEYLFGCIGLRHKKYCILNRQYTKETYLELVEKIKQQMADMPYTDKRDNVYSYGEFFPAELSPYSYEESLAQEFFPLSTQEIKESGYTALEKFKNEYAVTMQVNALPDNIRDVDDSILKEVVGCANATNNKCSGSGVFRFIPKELEFYKKNNIPLPRLCPICRHETRTKRRSPLKLYKRQCMCDNKEHDHRQERCQNFFETTYAPERKEIIYCKSCYQKEVE